MTDIELLELAAKAAGIPDSNICLVWNPLTDDGDALRMAVKLEFDVWVDGDAVEIFFGRDISAKSLAIEYVGNGDAYAATRRAIVRAAAVIGEQNEHQ